MLGIELQQTRVYQEARAEGETIGEVRVIGRDLNGARNILLRALSDSTCSVTSDGIAIVTSPALHSYVEKCSA